MNVKCCDGIMEDDLRVIAMNNEGLQYLDVRLCMHLSEEFISLIITLLPNCDVIK